MSVSADMFFVGDFYQPTFNANSDGVVNRNLFHNKGQYM